MAKKQKKVLTTEAKRKPKAVEQVASDPTPRIDLGPVLLPGPEDAVLVLKELAEINDRALNAHKRYEELREQCKDAKAKWESLAEEVQTKLRLATHPSELPLLTQAEREVDHAKMVDSARQDAPDSTIGDGMGLEHAPI